MPRPHSGRQALEQGRAELPGLIASYQRGRRASRLAMTTRADRAGLQIADVPRPLLTKLMRRHKLDAKI